MTGHRCRSLLLFLLLLAPVLCVRSSAATSAVRDRFLSTEFSPVRRVERISPPVMSALHSILGERKLSDPFTVDKATQVAKPTPGDRLVFAGSSPALWFVYCELDGPEVSHHVVILTLGSSGQAKVAEHLVLKTRAFSAPDLKNAIRRGEFTVVTEQRG